MKRVLNQLPFFCTEPSVSLISLVNENTIETVFLTWKINFITIVLKSSLTMNKVKFKMKF